MTRDEKSFTGWKEYAGVADIGGEINALMFQAWLASKRFYLAEVERLVGMRLDETQEESEDE